MNRLVLQSACVHGYFGNCHFTDYTTPDPVVCDGGSERVVEPDYDRAWEFYYETAGRRFESGLTGLQVKQLVDRALGADSE